MRTHTVTALSAQPRLNGVANHLWLAGFLGVDFYRGVLEFGDDALDWLCDLPEGRDGRCTDSTGSTGHVMWLGEACYPVQQVATR